MIDEMTAMNEEIIELTAEVGVLRAFVAKVAKLAGKDLLTDYDARVLATFYIEQAVGLAANVTSEELQDMDAILDDMMADELNEPAFKVGDEVIWQGDKLKVSNIFFDDDCSMWCYDFEDFDFCAIESALERA